MQPFKVTLECFNDFIMRYPVTLDALLAAMVSRETGARDDDTLPLIPLLQTHGVFHGSSMQLLNARTPLTHLNRVFVMALRGTSDLSTRAFSPNAGTKKNRKYGWVNLGQYDYKRNLTTYDTKRAHAVVFYGHGDIVRVQHLFDHFFMGLGKRASRGQGQVESVTVTPMDEDLSLIAADGTPARPIPVSAWGAIQPRSRDDVVIGIAGCQVPYHDVRNQVTCVLPHPIF